MKSIVIAHVIWKQWKFKYLEYERFKNIISTYFAKIIKVAYRLSIKAYLILRISSINVTIVWTAAVEVEHTKKSSDGQSNFSTMTKLIENHSSAKTTHSWKKRKEVYAFAQRAYRKDVFCLFNASNTSLVF